MASQGYGNDGKSRGFGSGSNGPRQGYGKRTTARVSPDILACSDLPRMLKNVLGNGCAVTIGTTRDGGAVFVRTLSNGNSEVGYGGSQEELDAVVTDVADAFAPRPTIAPTRPGGATGRWDGAKVQSATPEGQEALRRLSEAVPPVVAPSFNTPKGPKSKT